MKKTILLITVTLALLACNDSEKKKSIKIGAVQVSETEKDQNPLQASMERGGLVYTDFCMQCHLANGKGVPGNFPPLAGSNWLKDKRTESIRAVKFGQKGEIEVNGKPYNGVMVPMGLSDEEVADVMNYVMNKWENTQEEMVTEAEVAKIEE
ncbi:c-type cytochrome [Rasiella sp. SM2506]|uniref:c-type cytochrome n=1 Tax=Rasiella sp. SM2506 TaxID=3423914 RepID=UPI003D7A2816